jgi:hypothetical protein
MFKVISKEFMDSNFTWVEYGKLTQNPDINTMLDKWKQEQMNEWLYGYFPKDLMVIRFVGNRMELDIKPDLIEKQAENYKALIEEIENGLFGYTHWEENDETLANEIDLDMERVDHLHLFNDQYEVLQKAYTNILNSIQGDYYWYLTEPDYDIEWFMESILETHALIQHTNGTYYLAEKAK